MSANDLHDLLAKLHSQIEHAQTLSKSDLDQLRDLEGELRALLARSQDQVTEPQPTILDQLDEGIRAFEVSHPTLAMTISEVMAILSNAGI